jgi:hypothetical protein
MLISDIGLCSEGSLGRLLSFGIRHISACHILLGTFPSTHIACIRLTVIVSATVPPCWIISAFISSGPAAFYLANALISDTISVLDGILSLLHGNLAKDSTAVFVSSGDIDSYS